jgi:hypothetical protein
MDGAEAVDRCVVFLPGGVGEKSKRARGCVGSSCREALWTLPLVQILVVVAMIQVRILKTEVEQGSV